MKRNTKLIIALMLALVLSLSCLSLIGCGKKHDCESKCEVCGKCTDLECSEKACKDKCSGHSDTPTPGPTHQCEHKCETCGKCTDESCTDDACAAKCEGHEDEYISIPITGEVRYDLGVIKGFAKLSNVSVTNLNCEEGESCVTDFSWDKNSSVTMEIWSNAKEDVEGDLVMKVRRTAEVITLTSQISVEVNGDVLESDAQVPASHAGVSASFAEVNLGKFWLTPGKNVIVVKPQSNIANFDFSAITFYSTEEVNLQWYAMHEIDGVLFNGLDDHVSFDGDFKANAAENCLGVGGYGAASATFPVYSSREAKAKIYVVTNSMPIVHKVTDYFNWTINDSKVVSDVSLPYSDVPWGNYEIVYVGEYVIDAGLNEVKLAVNLPVVSPSGAYAFYNLRGIIIETDAKVGFEEQTAEAHVCISACPTCGGCKDEDCQDAACTTKCVCVHVCENACAICGGCKNADCSKEECATKCSCVSKTIVAATDSVIEQGNVDPDGNLGCKCLDGKAYRTKFHYALKAETAGKAEISIVISSTTFGSFKATDVYMTTINGTTYTSEAMTVNDHIAWTSFHTIKLGTIDLVAGLNVIAFDHYHINDYSVNTTGNWGDSVNFQSLILKTNVSYVVTHDVCVSKCATCGGCKDDKCTEEVCATKCTCDHVCESVCAICGGCKNAACEKILCKTKCDCTKDVFKLTGLNVTIEGQKYNVKEDCVGTYHDGTQFHPVITTYNLTAEKAGKVKLYFTVTRYPSAGKLIGGAYDVTINGTAIESDAQYVAGAPWADYDTILVGIYDLVEGDNVIVINYNHPENQPGGNLNFRCITLEHSASNNIVFTSRGAVTGLSVETQPTKVDYSSDEKFDASGLQLKVSYEDGTSRVIYSGYTFDDTLTEGQTAVTVSYTEGEVTKTVDVDVTVTEATERYVFNGNDARVALSSEWLVRQNVVDSAKVGEDNVITYKLTSDKAKKAELYLSVTTWHSVLGKLTDIYRITVNGTTVRGTVNNPLGGMWGDPVEQLVATVDLVEGENVIVLTYNPSDWQTINFAYIALKTSAKVEFANATPVLESVSVKRVDKTEYVAGEKFDTNNFRLLATYTDGTTRQIGYGFVVSSEALTVGQTSVTASYTENGVTKTVDVAITVAEAESAS